MYCEQCQHELPDDALFCDLCGARQSAPADPQDDQVGADASDSPTTEEPEAKSSLDETREQGSDKEPESKAPANAEPTQKPKSRPWLASTRASKQEPELDSDQEAEPRFGETEETPLPEIDTMNWAAESAPTVAPPTFPEEPQLPRSTVISIAIISVAVAVLLLLLAAWTILRLLHL